MECNFLMEQLLTDLNEKDIRPSDRYFIWQANTLDGNPFFCVGNFCGFDTAHVIEYGKGLTELEWQGNEIFLHEEEENKLVERAMGIYSSLKTQMEQNYPHVEFDLIVALNLKDKTGNIRFYAIRENYHYIMPDHKNLEGFLREAVLIDTINGVEISKFVDLTLSEFSKYQLELKENEENPKIIIKNPIGEGHMQIYFDDQITMCFGKFHAHYGYEEYKELFDDIKSILSGEGAILYVESDGKWISSTMVFSEIVPLTSKSKLLKYLFKNQKDLYKKVQNNGGMISFTYWDATRNKTYSITEIGIKEI